MAKSEMKLVAVSLKGAKDLEYFEVDGWSTDKGVLTLVRYDAPGAIAAFPFDNLLGVIDLTAKAHLSGDQLTAKLRALLSDESPLAS